MSRQVIAERIHEHLSSHIIDVGFFRGNKKELNILLDDSLRYVNDKLLYFTGLNDIWDFKKSSHIVYFDPGCTFTFDKNLAEEIFIEIKKEFPEQGSTIVYSLYEDYESLIIRNKSKKEYIKTLTKILSIIHEKAN